MACSGREQVRSRRMSRNSMMGNSAPRQRSVLRDAVLAILLLLTTRVQAADPVFTGWADPPDQLLSLWYSRPAGEWLEAVPIGNGRLGGEEGKSWKTMLASPAARSRSSIPTDFTCGRRA